MNLLIFIAFLSAISCVTIDRRQSGDVFEVTSCNTCHQYAAQCSSLVSIFKCCSVCKCDYGDTIYGDMCYSNLAHSKFGTCKLYLLGSQYNGFPITKLQDDGTSVIGTIMYDEDWSQLRFDSCQIHERSSFWDTKSWQPLFSNGRMLTDFFSRSSMGVVLEFVGGSQQKTLYDGLLVQLKLACSPMIGSTVTSCLVLKFAGKRIYSFDQTTSNAPTTTTTPTTTTVSTTLKTTVTTTLVTTTPTRTTSTKPIEKSSTREHKKKTSITISTKSTSLSTKSSSASGDKSRSYVSVIIALSCTCAFGLFFCFVFIACRLRHSRRQGPQERRHLIFGNSYSYQASESGSLVTSSEFEEVHDPMYTDLNDLKIRYAHDGPQESLGYPKIAQEQNKDASNTMAIHYTTTGGSERVDVQTRRNNSVPSETQDLTEYTPATGHWYQVPE